MLYHIQVDLLFQNHSDLPTLEMADTSWLSLLTALGMLSATSVWTSALPVLNSLDSLWFFSQQWQRAHVSFLFHDSIFQLLLPLVEKWFPNEYFLVRWLTITHWQVQHSKRMNCGHSEVDRSYDCQVSSWVSHETAPIKGISKENCALWLMDFHTHWTKMSITALCVFSITYC